MSACCPRCDGAGTVPEFEVYLADGPCEGHYHAMLEIIDGDPPEALTAVIQANGEPALLDLPEDEVEAGDEPHEYLIVGPCHMHGERICRRYYAYESRFGRLAREQDLAATLDAIARRQAGMPERVMAPVLTLASRGGT